MLWRDAEVGSLHSAVERPPCAMQKALVRVRNWEETLHSSGHKKQSVICGKSCLLKTRVQTIFQEKGKKRNKTQTPHVTQVTASTLRKRCLHCQTGQLKVGVTMAFFYSLH